MKALLTVLLLFGAHFNLTANVPAEEGRAWIGWPFAKDTKPIFGFLQNSSGTSATQLLSVIAAACFIAALLSLYGKYIPTAWWPYLIATGTISSILLYLMYLGPLAIIPLLVDIILLYGIFVQNWDKGIVK